MSRSTLLTILVNCVLLSGVAAAPATKPTSYPTDEDYAAHVSELRQNLSEDYTIIIQKPFIVIGDESPAVVRERAERTVKWAVDHLKRAYFSRDPDRIINIWLFKDAESYEKNVLERFGEKPGTPFGYYSPSDNALVMNISTGGGTLVHEIVHPFIEANFPECPAWFNEGLGSLYEQSAERDGKIVGLPNWRLAGLKRAFDEDRLLTFEALTALSTSDFYGEESGRNYAQARYLCLYLQEHGLLQRFYRTFAEDQENDPTGYQSLRAILGGEVEAHEREFEEFIRALRFP